MKKVLLPALIAAVFAAHVGAAEREFLFGPSEPSVATVKPKPKKTPKPAAVAKVDPVPQKTPATEPVVAAPVVVTQQTKPAAAVVVVAPVVVAVVPVVPVAPAKPAAVVVAPVVVAVVPVAPAKTVAAVAAPVVVAAAPAVPVKPAVVIAAAAPIAAIVAAANTVAPAASAALPAAAPVAAAVAAAPAVAPTAFKIDPKYLALGEIERPPAAVFQSEEFTAPAKVVSSDSLTERGELVKRLPKSVSIGFYYPSTTGQDSFLFQSSFLPISNYLSTKSGVLTNFVPERDLGTYRNNIANAQYPYIFINAALARDAAKSGYVPMVLGAEELAPGFVARADGKYKDLTNLKGARISYSQNAQTGMLAQAFVAKAGFAKDVKFNDSGTLGYAGVVNDLTNKNADIIVLRTSQVEELVKKSNGQFISIGKGEGAASAGWWVRKDIADSVESKKIESALLDVSPTAEGPAKFASLMFSRGYGVQGKFALAEPNYVTRVSGLLDLAEQNFGSYFSKPLLLNQKLRTANMERPVFAPLVAVVGKDPLSIRAEYIAKMKEGLNLGFFVSNSSSQDVYSFQSNFMPLANYLSDQTGVLVSMIPERDSNEFIRKIGLNEYPVILIGPSLAQAALAAGYLPAARAGDFVSPGFLVPASSNIKTLADISGKRLGTVRSSDAATVGRWEMLGKKVKESAIDFFGSSADVPAVLGAGAVDVVLIRSTEALEYAKSKGPDGKPKYRAIIGTEEVPAVSVWIRHDVYDFPLAQTLAGVFREFNGSGSDLKAKAFAGYARGFGVKDPWQISGIEEHTSSVQMIDGLVKAKISLVNEMTMNSNAVASNRLLSIVYPLVKSAGYAPPVYATSAAAPPVIQTTAPAVKK